MFGSHKRSETLKRFDCTRNPKLWGDLRDGLIIHISCQTRFFLKDGNIPYLGSHSIKFVGIKKPTLLHIISFIGSNRHLTQGCQEFLVYVTWGSEVKKELTEVSVVCDYPVVFSNDVPGLPPDREVEFFIDMVPGTATISKVHIEWRLRS